MKDSNYFLVFDQFLFSALNFLISVFLAKKIGINDFGIYSFLLMSQFLFKSFYNSLFINPLFISYDKNTFEEKKEIIFLLNLIFLVGLTLLIYLFIFFYNKYFLSIDLNTLLPSFVLYFFFYILYDFKRNYLILRRKYNELFVTDFVTFGVIILILLFSNNFYLQFFILIQAILFFIFSIQFLFFKFSFQNLRSSFKLFIVNIKNFYFLFLNNISQFANSNFIILLLGTFFGVEEIGKARIGQSFASLINNFIIVSEKVVLKRFSQKKSPSEFIANTFNYRRQLLLFIIPFASIFFLLSSFFAASYYQVSNIEIYILMFGINSILLAYISFNVNILKALSHAKIIFFCSLICSILNIILAIFLGKFFGYFFYLIIILLSNILLAFLTNKYCKRLYF